MIDNIKYAHVCPPLLHPQTAKPPKFDSNTDKLCSTIAIAAVEIINGNRQSKQILQWLDPIVFTQLLKRSEITRNHLKVESKIPPRRMPPTLMSHKNYIKTPQVIESVIVVQDYQRVRAITIRLELQDSLWKVKMLEIG